MASSQLPGKDIIGLLMHEASNYNTVEDIEKLVEMTSDLTSIPVQPLYLSLKNTSSDLVAKYLPMLDHSQRQVFLDLDLWVKDHVDVKEFEFWLDAYTKCPEEQVILEFVSSSQFLLYLKGICNIWTFDVEDPQYPDHDYYFLTDDNLLLFEYNSEYRYADQIQFLIRRFYAEVGVENAYAHLFKILIDNYLVFQEEEFQEKDKRMRDYGFVDYFESLRLTSYFPSIKNLENFVAKVMEDEDRTGQIETIGKMQALHRKCLIPYEKNIADLQNEIEKVSDGSRSDFLRFNFIKLVNSSLALHNALKQGSVAMGQVGHKTRVILLLGLSYLTKKCDNYSSPILQKFTFFDLYKIGNTLVILGQKRIKKVLNIFESVGQEAFLGDRLGQFVDQSFLEPLKVKELVAEKWVLSEVDSVERYLSWEKEVTCLEELQNVIQLVQVNFLKLIDENKIQSDYYLNYDLDDIDFEAIIISSFIHFSLDHWDLSDPGKMGVTVSDLKTFSSRFLQESQFNELNSKALNFWTTLGVKDPLRVLGYFLSILSDHLDGYQFNSLNADEFCHVGGPMILVSKKSQS